MILLDSHLVPRLTAIDHSAIPCLGVLRGSTLCVLECYMNDPIAGGRYDQRHLERGQQ